MNTMSNVSLIKIFFVSFITISSFFFHFFAYRKTNTIHQNCQQAFICLLIIFSILIFLTYNFKSAEPYSFINDVLFLTGAFCYIKLLHCLKNIIKFRNQFSQNEHFLSLKPFLFFSKCLLIATFVIVFFPIPYQRLGMIAILLGGLGVSFYLIKNLPEIIIKSVIYGGLKFIFRVQLRGMEYYPNKDERVLIIVNHVSFLDFLLLAAFLPDNLAFIAHAFYTRQPWIKLFLPFTDTYTVDYPHSNLLVIKSLIKKIKEQYCRCVIFPEGKISTIGTLMKIYEGPGLIADKAQAYVLPICIEGPQYTYFTKKNNQVPRRFFPRVTITIQDKKYLDCSHEIKGRERRKRLSYQVADIMAELMLLARDCQKNIFLSLLEAKKKFGRHKIILEDMYWQKLTYQQLVTKSFILGQYIKSSTSANKWVGILLPNSIPAIVLIFSLYIHGKTPAILNFTLGQQVLLDALHIANIRTIFTSRQFIQKANLSSLIQKLALTYHIVYLEDIRQMLSFKDKFLGFISGLFPSYFYHRHHASNLNEVAVLLFTSGTESTPKAVLLSHANIQTNCYQLHTKFDFNYQDIAFNALPLFHSFGFLGAIMPLILGVHTFCYPSPLHYRMIPELCYDLGATIIYATDTFLKGYALRAHPFDFYKIRYVFTGAEKLKEETQALWFEKFGIRIIEGYGITETGPVIATNTLTHYKPGTVGRFLPMVKHRLEKVEGLEGENIGRLFVRGPNIMMGYLINQGTSPRLLPPEKGWHDTGDIVEVDSFGFVTILGRAKRFAKIAGEMISLNAIENHALSINNKYLHTATCLNHPKKGDTIVLLTECQDLVKNDFIKYYQSNKISMLLLPKVIFYIKTIPKTATGKIDYRAVTQLAMDMMAT